MKRIISKLLLLISILLTSVFILTSTKTYAASNYSISTFFTFSSDMDIDKGFELIKPYILYNGDNLSTLDYEFNVQSLGDKSYKFTGYYPDGTRFSITSTIRILNDASGTYVEVEHRDTTKQAIYVTNLKEGKTTSDCLMECWKNRWVNVKYPTYSIETGSSPGGNIYNHGSNYISGAGEELLLTYFAIYDPANYSESNPQSPDDSNEDIITPGENPDNPNITPDDSSNTNQPNNNQSNNIPTTDTNETNPIQAIVICIGVVVSIVLIYELYKLFKLLFRWLKR